MKKILITEEQLHKTVAIVNAEILNKEIKNGTIDAVTGLLLTFHTRNVINDACDHLFNKRIKNV